MTRPSALGIRQIAAFAVATMVAACATGATPSTRGTFQPSPGTVATTTTSTSGSASATQPCAHRRLVFELSFIANVQHAGFLVASRRGYFTDEGLDVDIKPAGPGVDVAQEIASGAVDLGQVDYADVVRARAAGATITAVAQTYKQPYVLWYANRKKGIGTVADWKGHTVGAIQAGSLEMPESPERDAMLTRAGLDPATDVTVIHQDFGTADFMAGKVDIAEGFVFYHPTYLAAVDHKAWPEDFDVFYPAENGAQIASQTVVASDRLLGAAPDAITCFLRASIRGWQAAFQDPQAAVDDVLTFIPENTLAADHQRAAINDVLPIVATGIDDPRILEPTPELYRSTIGQMRELGLLGAVVDAATTFDSSFWEAVGAVPTP